MNSRFVLFYPINVLAVSLCLVVSMQRHTSYSLILVFLIFELTIRVVVMRHTGYR
jgi:hypothetical protein